MVRFAKHPGLVSNRSGERGVRVEDGLVVAFVAAVILCCGDPRHVLTL
jgi:hypothetical protein